MRVTQRSYFPFEAFPDTRVRMVLITFPTRQRSAANAVQARSVAFEVAAECPLQESFGFLSRNCRVLKVEFVLPVNVGEIYTLQHAALRLHLRIKRCARDRRVEHELMEVGFVRHSVLD